MNGLKEALVGLASAILSSMGLGGGGVLLVYLTGFTSLSQINAQGINLIFFIPIAFVSCVLHLKNKLIDKTAAIFVSLGAVPFCYVGYFLAGLFSQEQLRQIFAFFLLAIGIKEIIVGIKTKNAHR